VKKFKPEKYIGIAFCLLMLALVLWMVIWGLETYLMPEVSDPQELITTPAKVILQKCDYCNEEKHPMFEWNVAFKGMKFKRTVCIDCFIKALDLVLGNPGEVK